MKWMYGKLLFDDQRTGGIFLHDDDGGSVKK